MKDELLLNFRTAATGQSRDGGNFALQLSHSSISNVILAIFGSNDLFTNAFNLLG